MEGSLHTYDEGRRLVLFAHGWADHAVVFIGGLTDGFNAVPYLGSLADGLRDGSSWFLVQLQIRSSFLGYGVHSLDEDAEDVENALRYLRVRGVRSLVVMGHSTGCQDIVHMMKHRDVEGLVAGCVLQAPVSDREFAATLPGTASGLELARAMRDRGKADELMPREADEAPVTARRYLSLYDQGGGDDYFSSDLGGAHRPVARSRCAGFMRSLADAAGYGMPPPALLAPPRRRRRAQSEAGGHALSGAASRVAGR